MFIHSALKACRAISFLSMVLLILGLILCQSCKVEKPMDPYKIDVANYPGRKIIVGTQGGVANLRSETIILLTGEVYYHNNFVNEYKYLKTLKKEEAKMIFKMVRSRFMPRDGFNHPGNMSTFLETYNHQQISQKYIWGEPGVDIPEGLDRTYSQIITIIK